MSALDFKRWLKSASFAYAGLRHTYQTQPNFRIEVWAALLVTLCGVLLRLRVGEWGAVLLCCGLVLSLELLNTALEAVVDFISPEYHPHAKIAKDAAAAAVLVAALVSVIVGVIIFTEALRRFEWFMT